MLDVHRPMRLDNALHAMLTSVEDFIDILGGTDFVSAEFRHNRLRIHIMNTGLADLVALRGSLEVNDLSERTVRVSKQLNSRIEVFTLLERSPATDLLQAVCEAHGPIDFPLTLADEDEMEE